MWPNSNRSICIRHSTIIKFLLQFIILNEMNSKEVVFADDISAAGSLNSIKNYWHKLTAFGPKRGYFPKTTKSCLIVKENKLMEAQKLLLIQEWISQLKEKTTPCSYWEYKISWQICERCSKRLGQLTYHFVNYSRNTTASSLF